MFRHMFCPIICHGFAQHYQQCCINSHPSWNGHKRQCVVFSQRKQGDVHAEVPRLGNILVLAFLLDDEERGFYTYMY